MTVNTRTLAFQRGTIVVTCLLSFTASGQVREAVPSEASKGKPEPAAPEVFTVGHVKVTKHRFPSKRQDFEIVVPAKASEVWKAITTEEGLRSFYVPAAKVELTPGGAYEMYYKPDAPPGQRGMEGTQVLTFVPNEMLAGTGSAPPQFPTVQKEKIRWVMLFDDLGNGQTRFQMSVLEWGDSPEWNDAFDYFLKNNPAFPEALYKRFAEGPVDWASRGITLPPQGHGDKIDSTAGRRLIRVDQSVLLKAGVGDVWHLLTTDDGLRKWAAPHSNIQLKFGGDYELYYRPSDAPGERGLEGTKVLAYLPNEMLSYSWLADSQYPEVRKGPVWMVWRLRDDGGGWVRARYTALGMGEGPEWDNAFHDLEQRMAFELRTLKAYFK